MEIWATAKSLSESSSASDLCVAPPRSKVTRVGDRSGDQNTGSPPAMDELFGETTALFLSSLKAWASLIKMLMERGVWRGVRK